MVENESIRCRLHALANNRKTHTAFFSTHIGFLK